MATRKNEQERQEVPDNNPVNPNNKQSFPPYLEAAARLSTSRPLGAPRTDRHIVETLVRGTDNSEIVHYNESSVPGLAVIDYMPTLGISGGPNSPLNRAAFYEFNRIREKISGNRPYEPVDHMIYRQCVDALRELYAYIRRAYKIIRSYSALNVYKPRYVMEAMNLDFDDWNMNSALVYQWLCNQKSALLPFPTLPIGKISARREAFNSAIFLDGDSPTAQAYIFNQVGFYSYENVDSVKGISIRTLVGDGKVQDYFDLWNDLYTALQSSSDVYLIAADIRRAFENDVITDLTPPGVDDCVDYVKLDPVLTNIMNATTLVTHVDGGWSQQEKLDVADAFRIYDGGNGILLCDGSFDITVSNPNPGDTLPPYVRTTGFLSHLNFVESNPDTTAIINAVRLKPVLTNGVYYNFNAEQNRVEVTANTRVKSIATEAVITCRCYQLHGEDIIDVASPSTVTLYTAESIDRFMEDMSITCNFDWMLPQHFTNPNDRTGFRDYTVEDIQNYVPIDETVLMQLHESILLSEFNVPG